MLPDPEWPVAAGFWAGARAGELRFPRCAACGRFVWYPLPRCPACRGRELDWEAIEPRGHVHSFTVLRRAFLPQFEERIPHAVVQVRFADAPGVTLVTALADPDAIGDVRVGCPVEIVFAPAIGELLVPLARLLVERPD